VVIDYSEPSPNITDDDSGDFGSGTDIGTQWDGGSSWLEYDGSKEWQLPDSAVSDGWGGEMDMTNFDAYE